MVRQRLIPMAMNEAEAIFAAEAVTVGSHFPELSFLQTEDGKPFITGNLPLKDEAGCVVDCYEIMVMPSPDFPERFPLVFEIGGRLPHNIDWHVFPEGHCCIANIPEEILACRDGMTLHGFISDRVIPYFFNQKFREVHGYFLNERSHGALGNIEFFMDLLATKNLSFIGYFLRFVLRGMELNRVDTCFCGSGRKYRHCHREAYRTVRRFKDEELEGFMEALALM